MDAFQCHASDRMCFSQMVAMKKFNVFCLMLLTFLASNHVIAEDKQQALTIITEHFPPFQIYEADTQALYGVRSDVVMAALKQSGIQFDLKVMPWARGYTTAINEPNTCIFSILRFPQREELFQWVGKIGITLRKVYALKDRKKAIKAESLAEIKQYTTVVQREDILQHILEDKGFKVGVHMIPVTDWTQAIQMVMKGRADLITTNELILAHYMKASGVDISIMEPLFLIPEFSDIPQYVACSLTTDEHYIDTLKKSLNAVKAQGVTDKINARWADLLGLSHMLQ